MALKIYNLSKYSWVHDPKSKYLLIFQVFDCSDLTFFLMCWDVSPKRQKLAFVPEAGYTLCHSHLSLMKDNYHYLAIAFGPASKTGVLYPVRGVQGWTLSTCNKVLCQKSNTRVFFFFRCMSYSVAVSELELGVFMFVLSS